VAVSIWLRERENEFDVLNSMVKMFYGVLVPVLSVGT